MANEIAIHGHVEGLSLGDDAYLSREVAIHGHAIGLSLGADVYLSREVAIHGHVDGLMVTDDADLALAEVKSLRGSISGKSLVNRVDNVTGGVSEEHIIDSSLDRVAQTITPSSEYNLVTVRLRMYRIGSPGYVYLDIREVEADDPSPFSIVTTNRNGNTLTLKTGGMLYDFNFDTILESDKVYALVVRCPAADGSNKVVLLGANASIYAGGSSFISGNSGVTWTEELTKDLYFETLEGVRAELSREGRTWDLSGSSEAKATFDGCMTIAAEEILIPFQPEGGMTEQLGFLTDVLEKLDGREQRMQLRQYPRRQYGMTLRVDGTERQWLDNVLSGRQAGDLYLPLWTQPTLLTTAIKNGDATTISVDHTWQDQAEFRIGNKFVIWGDSGHYDMYTVTNIGSGSFDLATPTANGPDVVEYDVDGSPLTWGYKVGTPVYPVVKVMCPRVPSGSIMGLSMADVKIELLCKDNESDIASVAAWDEVHGLPYLADLHLGPSLGYVYDFSDMDFATGKTEQETRWTEGKQSRSLILVSNDRTTSWDIRCLLYYLAGKWKSFYLPTYLAEVPFVSLVGTTLTIGNVGYSLYSAGRTMVRIVTSTEDTVKTVESSVDAGATEELTLDGGVTGTVVRVEFVYRVRLDSDDISLTHANGLGTMRADLSIRSVPIGVKDLDEDE